MIKNIIALILIAPTALFAQTVIKAFPNLTFNAPIDLQYASDGDDRLFVAERNVRILVFVNDPETATVKEFLNISAKVSTSGEGGLLGFAFHPAYSTNGYIYVYYTASSPFRSVISKFQVSSEDPDMALSGTEEVLLEVEQPYSNHNAGQIRFGPDGYLYIALGDGGSGGDPHGHGQNRSTLLGSILRIDIDHTQGDLNYAIPPDNPFAENENGYRGEIYAYGLRNPYRFSFDSETGNLWAADVGQGSLEEVNIIQKGKNYGWNIMEGTQCYNPSNGCNTSGLESPVFEYGRSEGKSVTGGFVYRGEAVPELYGRYVYADFISGNIWSFNWDGIEATDNVLIDAFASNQIIMFGEDQNAELYFGAFDGNLYKFKTEQPILGVNENDITGSVSLNQNFPNPFYSTTEISFALYSTSEVEVKIYDHSGKKVRSLFEGVKGVGEHNISFNATGLPEGIYFCELKTEKERITRKMVFISN